MSTATLPRDPVWEAGQLWITGECWLYCERTDVPVMWLGPAQWLGYCAPLHACAPCVRRLNAKVRRHMSCRDSLTSERRS